MHATTTRAPQGTRQSTARPGFHQFNGRRLFGLEIVPTGVCRGTVLYLPPHVEEMNRCRSHVVLQARALAALGWHCLLLDPHGTGESDGETDAADWDHWLADAGAAAAWLAQQTGHAPTLWGIRTGALLATELAAGGQVPVAGLLLWQPVLDGKLYLNQYLRLRIASQLVREGDKETTESIRVRLAAGEVVEIAGYPLSGRLAAALSARRMAGFGQMAGLRVDWLEVVAKPEQALAMPSRKLADSWAATDVRVTTATVAGPMIWQLQEREEAPALQAASLRLMEAGR